MFNLDNQFFRLMSKVADGFCVSFLWFLFSIPIVTIGASTTALHYTVHKSLRGNRGYLWSNYWNGFRSNFKQSTIIWLIQMVIFVFLFMDYRITFDQLQKGGPMGMLCYFFLLMMIFWVVWSVYIFSYSARFENGMKETMKNAALLGILHLPWSILILFIFIVGLLAVYMMPPLVLAVPALAVYLYDLFLEKIFRKYMSEEDLKREQEYDEW